MCGNIVIISFMGKHDVNRGWQSLGERDHATRWASLPLKFVLSLNFYPAPSTLDVGRHPLFSTAPPTPGKQETTKVCNHRLIPWAVNYGGVTREGGSSRGKYFPSLLEVPV